MHEGTKITENDTPASLDLEDGDAVRPLAPYFCWRC